MKYITLVPDGMADEPLAQLNGRTPLEAAYTPHMDALVQMGFSGMVQTIPDGMPPGSDIGNLSLLGYDPTQNFSGRAPLEAANMGVILKENQIAFRCNLVTLQNGRMQDYSAGHISSAQAKTIIESLNQTLGNEQIQFYPGKSYRHLLVLTSEHKDELLKIKTTPPHDILDANTLDYLPQGRQNQILLDLMAKAHRLLISHAINQTRLNNGDLPATDIWLWGQGTRPHLPTFHEKFGLTGSMISAVDLVNGIGRLTGLDIINVPGATGYYDTDYAAKARYAIESLKTHDFVYIHVESPDEAGHNGDIAEKVKAIEAIDREIVSVIRQWAQDRKDWRLLISPDHPTPIAKRTHTHAPVCFVMAGSGIERNQLSGYSESIASQAGLKFHSGAQMIARLFQR